MASKPWTAEETELLERHMTEPRWFRKVQPAFPHRTPKAIRCRMSIIRDENGVEHPGKWNRAPESSWQRKARVASDRLAEATLRVGTWT